MLSVKGDNIWSKNHGEMHMQIWHKELCRYGDAPSH